MRYCPYLYSFFAMNDSRNLYDDLPDYYEDELTYETDISDEEAEYYDEDMRQPSQQDINRIMQLLNSRLNYLYIELQRSRINRNTARYIFRFIVSYVVNNADKYSGSPEQKAAAILNDLRRQSPWIFYIMRANGIPQNRVNQIVRTVIAFALSHLQAGPTPPVDLEERATRITNLIRQQTDIFTRFQNLGVASSAADSIVRTIVLFVLRNINFNQPPANLETRTAELLRQLEISNPDLIKDLQNYGIQMSQIRLLIRLIIRFTLRNVYGRDEELLD